MSGDDVARGTLFVSTSTDGADSANAAAAGVGDPKFTATWTSGVPLADEFRAFLVGFRSKLRACGGEYIVAWPRDYTRVSSHQTHRHQIMILQ